MMPKAGFVGLILVIGSVALFAFWPEARADCPGSKLLYTDVILIRTLYSQPGGILWDFIDTGCTHQVFGPSPPTSCFAGKFTVTTLVYSAKMRARWPSPTPNTVANGCTFNCPGGTCRIRGGDGLPIELLEFTVE